MKTYIIYAYYTTAVPPLFLVRFPKCALRLVLFKVQMLCLQQSLRRQGWSLAITKCIMQADASAPSGHWWELPRGLSNSSALSTFVKSIWTLDIPSLALQWKSVNLPLDSRFRGWYQWRWSSWEAGEQKCNIWDTGWERLNWDKLRQGTQ